jgi:hypothetical protein
VFWRTASDGQGVIPFDTFHLTKTGGKRDKH